MDNEDLRRNINRLKGLVEFVGVWIREAAGRARAGDSTGAIAALKGLDTFLAEMGTLYQACIEVTAADLRSSSADENDGRGGGR